MWYAGGLRWCRIEGCDRRTEQKLTVNFTLPIIPESRATDNFVFARLSFTLIMLFQGLLSIGHLGRQYDNVCCDCNKYSIDNRITLTWLKKVYSSTFIKCNVAV